MNWTPEGISPWLSSFSSCMPSGCLEKWLCCKKHTSNNLDYRYIDVCDMPIYDRDRYTDIYSALFFHFRFIQSYLIHLPHFFYLFIYLFIYLLIYLFYVMIFTFSIIADLQCCVNFYCTAQWPSCTCIYILFFKLSSIMFYHKRLDILPCVIQ